MLVFSKKFRIFASFVSDCFLLALNLCRRSLNWKLARLPKNPPGFGFMPGSCLSGSCVLLGAGLTAGSAVSGRRHGDRADRWAAEGVTGWRPQLLTDGRKHPVPKISSHWCAMSQMQLLWMWTPDIPSPPLGQMRGLGGLLCSCSVVISL